ncbi:MAG: hypothetical protein HY461_00655 [Parcubacteria group bacterium]|nr:hypothetical protein [Parcubacteria group bacterium]
MAQLKLYRSLFGEALHLTWRYKGWWLVGLLILLFSGSLGYQLVGQGVTSLLRPDVWLRRWELFTTQLTPSALLSGQWELLTNAPVSGVSALFIMAVVGLALLVMIALGAVALTALISAMKQREQEGEFSLLRALREALRHFRPALGGVILLQIVSQVLLILFSIPVSAMAAMAPGALKIILTALVLVAFAVLALGIVIVSMYALIAIVVENVGLGRGIMRAGHLLRRAWRQSILLMFYQFVILFGVSLALVIFTSLIVIPLAIVGFVLVAKQQFNFTSLLPMGTFYLLSLLFIIFGSANTMFQVCSWCLMYFKLTEGEESAHVLPRGSRA